MSNGYQSLVAHFTANQWNFERDDANEIIRAGFAGKNAEFRCAAMVNDDEVVQFFAVVPAKIPAEKSVAIAEVCVRASFGMRIGDFEFDMEGGEVRFHASAPYPAGNLDDLTIRHLVGVSLVMIDKYYPAFMAVLFAGQSPKDAVAAIDRTAP